LSYALLPTEALIFEVEVRVSARQHCATFQISMTEFWALNPLREAKKKRRNQADSLFGAGGPPRALSATVNI